jgi:hypothetical protein
VSGSARTGILKRLLRHGAWSAYRMRPLRSKNRFDRISSGVPAIPSPTLPEPLLSEYAVIQGQWVAETQRVTSA